MKVKKESKKAGLKCNSLNGKTKIMVSGPITLWQIDGETMETVRDFILGGSKITENGNCSHEIKRCFLLGRRAMTNLLLLLSRFSRVRLCVTPQTANLDSIKSRDVTLPTKVRLLKAMVFPVVMYGCESCGLWRKLSAKELIVWSCGVGEDSWESLGLQGDPASQS